MDFAGHFRTVQHRDHLVPSDLSRSINGRESLLDVRLLKSVAFGGPMLLVSATRKHGKAVLRNQFKRRVRMALLGLLQVSKGFSKEPFVIWVRPRKGSRLDTQLSFEEIRGQLELALSRWMHP